MLILLYMPKCAGSWLCVCYECAFYLNETFVCTAGKKQPTDWFNPKWASLLRYTLSQIHFVYESYAPLVSSMLYTLHATLSMSLQSFSSSNKFTIQLGVTLRLLSKANIRKEHENIQNNNKPNKTDRRVKKTFRTKIEK